MIGWQAGLLIISALAVPAIWGYAVARVMDFCWPETREPSEHAKTTAEPMRHDFDI